MRVSVLPVLFSLALMLTGGVSQAQNSGKGASGSKSVTDPRPPSFPRLFKNPTHNNGYEEWVLAADLIQNNADVDAAVEPGATLTLKRHLLSDPAVTQALLLLREGLNKPIGSPREDYDENTILPELAAFRQLARLLRTEQYVDFAEGRVDAAIDSLRVGLAFGYRIQTDTLISGLVGLAVDTIMLDEFAHHFDQLSVYQCDKTLRIVQDFLNAENPAVRLLALEKSYALKMLETRRSDADALRTFLESSFDLKKHPEETPDVLSVQAHLTNRPQDVNTLIDSAQARIGAIYDQALLNLRLPLAQRTPFVKDQTNTPDASLCRLLAVDPQRVLDIYTRDQAKLRLLGIHLLIHHYRWERNALPSALTELHAAELVKDPFTGEQIVYQRDNDRYTLFSQGPFKRDEAGQAPSKERIPVKLIP